MVGVTVKFRREEAPASANGANCEQQDLQGFCLMNNAIWLGPECIDQDACVRRVRKDHDSRFRKFFSYSQYDFAPAQMRQQQLNNSNIWRRFFNEPDGLEPSSGLAHNFLLRQTFQ